LDVLRLILDGILTSKYWNWIEKVNLLTLFHLAWCSRLKSTPKPNLVSTSAKLENSRNFLSLTWRSDNIAHKKTIKMLFKLCTFVLLKKNEPIFSISLLVIHFRYIIYISAVKNAGGFPPGKFTQFHHFSSSHVQPLFDLICLF